jgi:hypothetical protein
VFDVQCESDVPIWLSCRSALAAEKMRLEIIMHAGVILAETGDQILHI